MPVHLTVDEFTQVIAPLLREQGYKELNIEQPDFPAGVYEKMYEPERQIGSNPERRQIE